MPFPLRLKTVMVILHYITEYFFWTAGIDSDTVGA